MQESKAEFICQFVLNRATASIKTDAAFWVQEAIKAWHKIQEECKPK